MDIDIVKIGNSQGVRLPKALLQDLKLQNNHTLHAYIEGGQLILAPKNPKKTQTFSAVLNEVMATGGVTSIKDASEWQRQQRQADWARDPREL